MNRHARAGGALGDGLQVKPVLAQGRRPGGWQARLQARALRPGQPPGQLVPQARSPRVGLPAKPLHCPAAAIAAAASLLGGGAVAWAPAWAMFMEWA